MGGNVKIGTYQAEPMVVTPRTRYGIVQEVGRVIIDLERAYFNIFNEQLFENKWTFSGSTVHLMNTALENSEFVKYKPTIGDIDIRLHSKHKKNFETLLIPGRCFGSYLYKAHKKHGQQISVLMQDLGCQIHQFDFEFDRYPEATSAFLHSASWDDIKLGIKGVHHKLLLNALGGDKYKFSITHGLKRRDVTKEHGIVNPSAIKFILFGQAFDDYVVESFKGLVYGIAESSPEKFDRQAIFDKFEDSCKKIKNVDHQPALEMYKGCCLND